MGYAQRLVLVLEGCSDNKGRGNHISKGPEVWGHANYWEMMAVHPLGRRVVVGEGWAGRGLGCHTDHVVGRGRHIPFFSH